MEFNVVKALRTNQPRPEIKKKKKVCVSTLEHCLTEV